MPRPLIIKIDTHKTQQNKKAFGSIDVNLLKENKTRNFYNHDTIDHVSVKNDRESTPVEPRSSSRSVVRNLISKYESSNPKRSNLFKYKSKSMADLQYSQVTTTISPKTSQDDSLYRKNHYDQIDSEPKAFDFKKIWSKFETSSQWENRNADFVVNDLPQSQPIAKQSLAFKDDSNLMEIKARAEMLLEKRDNSNVWEDEVIDLLRQIVDLKVDKDPCEEIQQNLNQLLNNFETEAHEEEKETAPEQTNVNSTFIVQETHQTESESEPEPEETKREEVRRTQSVDELETNSILKVKDIKNMFEVRSISGHPKLFEPEIFEKQNTEPKSFVKVDTSPKVPLKYFGKQDEGYVQDIKSEVSKKPLASSSPAMKIQGLSHILTSKIDPYVPYAVFVSNGKDAEEEEEDDYKIENESDSFSETPPSSPATVEDVIEKRMLPPPMIIGDDEEDDNKNIRKSKEDLEELTKHIEEFDARISELSEESKTEGGYINEVLLRILVRLDDVKTYGDEMIRSERRKALAFAQLCMQKLKEKIQGV